MIPDLAILAVVAVALVLQLTEPVVVLSLAASVSNGGAFLAAWFDPIYNTDVTRGRLQLGRFQARWAAYYEAYVKYVDQRGKGKPMRGSVSFGVLASVLYFAMIPIAYLMTYDLSPSYGYTAFFLFFLTNMAVVGAFYAFKAIWSHNALREATARGFDLIALRPRPSNGSGKQVRAR